MTGGGVGCRVGRAPGAVLLLLLAWKVALPAAVHLNRGNHEDALVATAYGQGPGCVVGPAGGAVQRRALLLPSEPLGSVNKHKDGGRAVATNTMT